MEGVEHQQGVLELFAGFLGQAFVVQQLDQRGDVVAALHGAEQLDGMCLVDQRRSGFATYDGGQEASLDVSGFINARGNAIGEQIEDELFFTGLRILEQFDQLGGLLGSQRLCRDALPGAFFNLLTVGFKHVGDPHL